MEDRGSPPSAESQRLRQICSQSRPTPPPTVLHAFTAENFLDEVVNWDGLVVVDFWAETRSLCKVMLPVMQRLAQRYAGMPVKIGRVDVLANAEFVESLGIKAIPHIMVILRGDVAIEFIGDKTFEELEKALAPFTSFARNGAAH